jgi:bifunctional non-homologous end joining protein LigD
LAIGDPSKLTYFVFDLLYLDGYDLRAVPLTDRKRALAALMAPVVTDHGVLHYSEHYEGDGEVLLAQVLRLGLEGIIAKQATSPYESGRSKTWLKIKGSAAQEFAIVGYTESKGAGGLASLLLAETVADGLQYVGKAGTGFTSATAKELRGKLEPLLRKEPIFTLKIAEKVSGAKWVEPKLFAEVEYANKTADGHLRAARYKGLRGPGSDDSPVAKSNSTAQGRPPKVVSDLDLAQVFITNPDRRMFSADGPTKLDLAVYYARVGDWILPHIAHRPLTLIRSPSGKVTDHFYQRHVRPGMPDEVKKIDLSLPADKEREEYLYITDVKGLLGLVQFGVVEIHPWGCKVDAPERPDRMVFDLDPDEGLDWRRVVEAAFDVRDFLTALGLVPFVRTTGGKGIHVVVPIERQSTWEEFKEFSHNVVQALAAHAPQRYTASIAKKDRKGRIFIDYLRNGRMATAVASYSLRARVGVPAACNITWDELYDLDDPQQFNWKTVPSRLADIENDPWADIEKNARRITKAMVGSVQKLIKG